MRYDTFTRRRFLGTAVAAGLAPGLLAGAARGQTSPGNRNNIALIGTGRQAILVNLPALLEIPEVRIVALCDVDAWRLDQAKQKVDTHYGNSDCAVYSDWREIIARDDIDAIMNSTPDHWHVPISLAAVQAGKHVSCEKPLTLSIAEGRRLAAAAKAAGVVFRTDSECRSHADMPDRRTGPQRLPR
jgi:predicted dehydrogenase